MPVGALNIRRAYRWHQRLRGLLGTASLPADEALHIRPCNSVHTAGMRYAIDVVFLDRRGQVLKIVPDLAPWRMAVCWRAHSVMELAAGQAGALGLVVGACVSLVEAPASTSILKFQPPQDAALKHHELKDIQLGGRESE